VIPFDPLGAVPAYSERNAAIVLTASQPFTSALSHQISKTFATTGCGQGEQIHRIAKRQPYADEAPRDVCVFYRSLPTYNKQYRAGKPYRSTNTNGHGKHTEYGYEKDDRMTVNDGRHNPCTIIQIPGDNKKEAGCTQPKSQLP